MSNIRNQYAIWTFVLLLNILFMSLLPMQVIFLSMQVFFPKII